MSVSSSGQPLRQVRVVLSSTALLSFVSTWKASALALAELGVSAFFIAGALVPALGAAAIWIVVAMCAIGLLVPWTVMYPLRSQEQSRYCVP